MTKNLIMTDCFEIKGKWFLPNDDCNKIPGTLCYSPKQIELKLIGMFEDRLPLLQCDDPSKSIIYGISDDGKCFTLVDCIPSHANHSSLGFGTISYTVNQFYMGTKLLTDASSDLVQAATFSFTNLNAWLRYNILEYSCPDDTGVWQCRINPNNLRGKQTIKIKAIDVCLKEELTYNLSFPKDFFLNENTELTINRWFIMESLSGAVQTVHTMFKYASYLKNLLTLLVGQPMFFTYIDFSLPDEEYVSSEVERLKRKHSCRMFYTQIGDIAGAKHLSPVRNNSCLIKKESILECWDSIVNLWFSEHKKIAEVTDSHIGDLYLPAYIQTAFLNIARGLEAYHRLYVTKPDDTTTVDSSKERVIAFINSNIPTEDRERILSRINYETEESFGKRIKQLITSMPTGLKNTVFGELTNAEQKRLITQIVQTRNYYTHRDNKEKYPLLIESPLEIAKLSDKLAIVLNYFCLTQIGVPADIVENALTAKWEMEI